MQQKVTAVAAQLKSMALWNIGGAVEVGRRNPSTKLLRLKRPLLIYTTSTTIRPLLRLANIS